MVAGSPVWHVFHARVSAMVSPALAAERLARVFGNGAPAAGAPAFTEAVRPERPCDGVVLLPAVWQPYYHSPLDRPAFFAHGTYETCLPRGETVAVFPLVQPGKDAMLWQADNSPGSQIYPYYEPDES